MTELTLTFGGHEQTQEPRLKFISKCHANSVFQACIAFLRFSGKAICEKTGSVRSRFTGVHLPFGGVSNKQVAHFCFALFA